MVQGAPGTFTMTDLEGLANVKEHPYLELSLVHGTFCLVGVAALDQGAHRGGPTWTCSSSSGSTRISARS